MFKEIFGNNPQSKVIDYLISTPFTEHTKQQIAVGSEISIPTLNKFIDNLVDILNKKYTKYIKLIIIHWSSPIFID